MIDGTSELITLGQRIRSIRQAKGLNLTQLAQLTGLSISAISTIETAQRDARATTLFRIAHALRVPVADLFAPEKTPEQQPPAGGYDLSDME